MYASAGMIRTKERWKQLTYLISKTKYQSCSQGPSKHFLPCSFKFSFIAEKTPFYMKKLFLDNIICQVLMIWTKERWKQLPYFDFPNQISSCSQGPSKHFLPLSFKFSSIAEKNTILHEKLFLDNIICQVLIEINLTKHTFKGLAISSSMILAMDLWISALCSKSLATKYQALGTVPLHSLLAFTSLLATLNRPLHTQSKRGIK